MRQIVILLIYLLVLRCIEAHKSCFVDKDCDKDEKCIVDKCKNACLNNPCAVNAVCKVSSVQISLLLSHFFGGISK